MTITRTRTNRATVISPVFATGRPPFGVSPKTAASAVISAAAMSQVYQVIRGQIGARVRPAAAGARLKPSRSVRLATCDLRLATCDLRLATSHVHHRGEAVGARVFPRVLRR